MEAEDDMFVVIIGEDSAKDNAPNTMETTLIPIKEEQPDIEEMDIEDLLKSAVEHGVVLDTPQNSTDLETDIIKSEPLDSDYEYLDSTDSNDSEFLKPTKKKKKGTKVSNKTGKTKKHGMLPPEKRYSFVNELRDTYPELQSDPALLIGTLAEIMRTTKPPEPPQDYYIMNDIMFECVFCGTLTDTLPAASRHYQEKHGPRYLNCYSCGADFRSKTNLYKHEKRCGGSDASTVLRARAQFLGRKARSRPFLLTAAEVAQQKAIMKQNKKPVAKRRYNCTKCSATFVAQRGLEAHLNMHAGIRPFICSACPAAYTSRTALYRHSCLHIGLEFICDHCKRSFTAKAALIAHMNTHKPERKFGCSLCGQRYTQRAALLLHHGRHAQLPQPIACKLCPKRFPRMSLLKKHMEHAHGMVIMTRKMFFKKLPMMTETQLESAKIVLKNEMESYAVLPEPLSEFEQDPEPEPEPESQEQPTDTETQEEQDTTPIQIRASEEITLEENQLVELVKYLQNYHNTGENNGKVMCVNDGQLLEVSYKDTDENGYKQVEVRPVFNQVQVSVTSNVDYEIEPEEIIVSKITSRKSMPEI